MNVFEHLVEWDQILLRVSGRRLQEMITRLVREKNAPVDNVELDFGEGRLVASAKIKKGISIPIRCTIRKVVVEGRTVRAALENLSTFGSIPLPKNLFRLVDELKLPEGISFNAETMTMSVKIDRFVPPFLDLTVKAIQFIPGGVALHLGEGHADTSA